MNFRVPSKRGYIEQLTVFFVNEESGRIVVRGAGRFDSFL